MGCFSMGLHIPCTTCRPTVPRDLQQQIFAEICVIPPPLLLLHYLLFHHHLQLLPRLSWELNPVLSLSESCLSSRLCSSCIGSNSFFLFWSWLLSVSISISWLQSSFLPLASTAHYCSLEMTAIVSFLITESNQPSEQVWVFSFPFVAPSLENPGWFLFPR